MRLEPISVEASTTITLDAAAYGRFTEAMAPLSARVTVERRIHKPGKRCLWGARKGFIQIGTREDADDMLRLDIPKANLTVEVRAT